VNYIVRPQLIAALLCLLFLSATQSFAGMTPAEVKQFEQDKALAEMGHPTGQYNLGVCYERGEGVARDAAQAAIWYRRAATQGNMNAQFKLGFFHSQGLGVAKDDVQAIFWCLKAAEQGDADAQVIVGIAYDNGEGVTKNFVEAVKWLEKSAKQGNATAQRSLATHYFFAKGVSRDYVEAYAYFNLAVVTDEQARKPLEIMESKMSREEMSAGQRRTRELKKEIEDNLAAKRAGK
jgi:TPR repeat protein